MPFKDGKLVNMEYPLSFVIYMTIAGFILGFSAASAYHNHVWCKESVRLGYAEYVLKDDQAVWQWKKK